MIDDKSIKTAMGNLNKSLEDFHKAQQSQRLAVSKLKDMGYKFDGVDWVKKPRTKVVYEKVNDLIFSLQDDLDHGKLYGINDDGSHWKIATTHTLAGVYKDRELYRKVEKEIDWRDEVAELVGCGLMKRMGEGFQIGGVYFPEIVIRDIAHFVQPITDKP